MDNEKLASCLVDGSKPVKTNHAKLLCLRVVSNACYLCIPALLALLFPHLSATNLADLLSPALRPRSAAVGSTFLALAVALYILRRPRPVYLVEFACFKGNQAYAASRATLLDTFTSGGSFDDETVAFHQKMLERSGISDEACIPASMMSQPLNLCHRTAQEEAETVIFGVVDEVFRMTGVAARDVGVLVTNCSLHNPTPAYTSMIVNRYKMPDDVVTYNLAGMGCSAGLIAIDLVRHLLQVHPNCYALVVSTENLTLHGYFGNNRSMLVTNSLFRMGGAAILLSNRPVDRRRSKYQLVHTVRTHRGADDRSYSCVTQEEDAEGKVGVALSKDLVAVAGSALKANITTLGPLVLPLSEQLLFLGTLLLEKVLKLDHAKRYMPDFKLAFEHFCIHAGGRSLLEGLEKSMSLSPWHMEPSRMTLYRFGNTSSSSLWYELAYCEAKARIERGDRVWQIAFGSGFKCNSAVWRSLRSIKSVKNMKNNPWSDEIDKFPVHVPKMVPLALLT
ncbi:putative 3-ketoacyl-CoA synthase 20 [Curcuma longa]|uniref:putative 3-ketoacyl-CoA synthase 20 n=1 Tax=Curcuma longa TaxID=136217 RepID=UPI003D9DB693